MDVNHLIDGPFATLPTGQPDARALSMDGENWWTYRDLREARNQYIHILLEAGVRAGDRVGMMLVNSYDYIALYFAAARMGAIAVRLNFRLAPEELQFLIEDSGSCVVFFHSSRASQLAPIQATTDVQRWFCIADGPYEEPAWSEVPALKAASKRDCDLPRPRGDQPVMLMYTSGTTGRPKGSIWTHDNTMWLCAIQILQWGFNSGSIGMTTGPLYHVGGFEIFVLPMLMARGSAVFMPSGAMSTDKVVDRIHRAGVTDVFLYPSVIYDILQMDDAPAKLDALRLIATGGDPLQPWAVDALTDRLPGVTLNKCYGLTEGGALCAVLEQPYLQKHPDSVGRPVALSQIRVIDENDSDVAPGVVGEVAVKSPAMSGVYWNREDATAQTFFDGWCRTGDLGRITPDGFLVLCGRGKDMIRSGGENIYPAEVENVLSRHPAVSSVALVGVPDSKYLEVGCAVVVLENHTVAADVLEQELRQLASTSLARYKCPKYYVFVDAIPISPSGKILKRELRDQYSHVGTA
jgi:fatty-acyl-CoA synthase